MAGNVLPSVTGYTAKDINHCQFPKCQRLECVNGYIFPKVDASSSSRKTIPFENSIGYLNREDLCSYDASLTYGRTKSEVLPQFLPWYVLYANKCLTFKAFFKQGVFNSPMEHYRIRVVNIIYFLEDDSIQIMEPPIDNAGHPQGKYLKRMKNIPKNDLGEYWHWKDLNVGIDIAIFGTVFHTIDADLFTKEFMASQGIDLRPKEDEPPDPYLQNRSMANVLKTKVTSVVDDKLRRFLEFDGKVLSFSCVWDNTQAEQGGMWEYTLNYFLADDTISVKEIHQRNDGREPFPLLLKKTKLSKNWKDTPTRYPACYLELSDAEVTEYYTPKDLIVGETIFVYGRRILLTDCDSFARNYYSKMLNIEQPQKIVFEKPEVKRIQREIPPHVSGIGSVEDSLLSCLRLTPKRPTTGVISELVNLNTVLRYTAKLVSSHPEDFIREFVFMYYLRDGKMKIMEPPIRNSGIRGGKFLSKNYAIKPSSDPDMPEYYTPADFYIGAQIQVHKHTFVINGCDLGVYLYIKANEDKFPKEVRDNIRNFIYQQGYLKEEIQQQMELESEQHKLTEFGEVMHEPEKPPGDLETCLAKLVTKTEIPNESSKTPLFEDMAAVDRKECLDEPPEQMYGITPVIHDSRYFKPSEPPALSSECFEVRDPPHIPCCIKPDCPEFLNVKDIEESREAYYKSYAAKHEQICNEAEKYYCQPCPKDKGIDVCPQKDACPLYQPKSILKKTFQFDPCLPEEDECKNPRFIDNCNCTSYGRK